MIDSIILSGSIYTELRKGLEMSEEAYIWLKWGGLKGWGNTSYNQEEALQKYIDMRVSPSAMMQVNTTEHKKALCDAIELFEEGQIQNDWCGTYYTVNQAKEYVMNYGRIK